MKMLDINNPENYEYKTPEECYISNCHKTPEYWINEDVFGLCKDCYKELCNEIRWK